MAQHYSNPKRASDPTQLSLDADLHLAWGKQPACGVVNRATTARLVQVTCKRCLRVADRAFMVATEAEALADAREGMEE